MFATQTAYRGELIQDPTALLPAARGVTPRQCSQRLIPYRYADPPHRRPKSTMPGSISDEATGQPSGAFRRLLESILTAVLAGIIASGAAIDELLIREGANLQILHKSGDAGDFHYELSDTFPRAMVAATSLSHIHWTELQTR